MSNFTKLAFFNLRKELDASKAGTVNMLDIVWLSCSHADSNKSACLTVVSFAVALWVFNQAMKDIFKHAPLPALRKRQSQYQLQQSLAG